MGFETMGAAKPPEKPKKEKPAFPEVVAMIEEAWNDAVMQQPDSHRDYNDAASVVAERLNKDEGFLWQRRQDGLSPEITPQEVLDTREAFFKP